MGIILASSSPRRQQMLRDLGVSFEIVSPNVDETRKLGEKPVAFVKRLAQSKAEGARIKKGLSFGTGPNWYLLSADTTVVSGEKILEKPRDVNDAISMAKRLSGKKHTVVTSFCWLANHQGRKHQVVEAIKTEVTFAQRSLSFWRWYAHTGEPLDKAGGYAAQGIGMSFIKSIKGSYANVVGLPLSHVLDSFESHFGRKTYELVFPCR